MVVLLPTACIGCGQTQSWFGHVSVVVSRFFKCYPAIFFSSLTTLAIRIIILDVYLNKNKMDIGCGEVVGSRNTRDRIP